MTKDQHDIVLQAMLDNPQADKVQKILEFVHSPEGQAMLNEYTGDDPQGPETDAPAQVPVQPQQ